MEELKDSDLVYVGPNDDLKTVLSCFKVNQISHVPVINDKRIIAMVSKTDVVEHLHEILPKKGDQSFESLVQEIKVKELMVQPIIEAQVTDTQRTILEKLIDHQVSSVVLKKGDDLVGIVTERDMIQYLAGKKDDDLSYSENLGMHVVKWLDENGVFRVSRALADIGI